MDELPISLLAQANSQGGGTELTPQPNSAPNYPECMAGTRREYVARTTAPPLRYSATPEERYQRSSVRCYAGDRAVIPSPVLKLSLC
jgi:hypothetical protein